MVRPQGGNYEPVIDLADDDVETGPVDAPPPTNDLEFQPSNFETTSAPYKPTTTHPNALPPTLQPLPSPSAPSTSSHLFAISYYTPYFDVDTSDVLSRIRLVLDPRSSFLASLSSSTSPAPPDLYGPIWIASTTVLILFLTGTISANLASKGHSHFAYDFRLLSGAAGLVYGYTLLTPLALWLALKYIVFRSRQDIPRGVGIDEPGANLVELWALYGYANVIWIPVALISWSNMSVLNWVFVGVGLGSSGVVLLRNLWPLCSAADGQSAKVLLLGVFAVHVGLAAMIKFTFFAHATPLTKGS